MRSLIKRLLPKRLKHALKNLFGIIASPTTLTHRLDALERSVATLPPTIVALTHRLDALEKSVALRLDAQEESVALLNALAGNIVIVYNRARTGASSLEIMLQLLGYNTIFVDPGRAKENSYTGVYEQILSNIADGKRLTEKIPNRYDAFIMGEHLSTKEDILKLKSDFKNIKFILCDRDHDSWVISMKNHQLVADRPNPRRQELIEAFVSWKKEITDTLATEKNFMTLNVGAADKMAMVCSFLQKKEPEDSYPHISTNEKLTLTREQIDH